ncbi:MAG TPA: substrate-binding domain-containing protein, partial [Acidimicrobiales bacterium]|nr:substrate-binding domain-containing protein [Acidimicrobiales bacterium]
MPHTVRRPPAPLLVVLVTLAVLAAACGGGDSPNADPSIGGGAATGGGDGAQGDISISGSSTVEPISIRVAELYEDIEPDVNVDVDGPGTGDGFQLFCRGDADIADASRPIQPDEVEACEAAGVEFVELKVGIDGLAVLTSPANDA